MARSGGGLAVRGAAKALFARTAELDSSAWRVRTTRSSSDATRASGTFYRTGCPFPCLRGERPGRRVFAKVSVSELPRLTPSVLEGNRWPAVSGAMLAELALRSATLGAMTATAAEPRASELEVRFRKAIPVAEARRRPRLADGMTTLDWRASVEAGTAPLAVADVRAIPASRTTHRFQWRYVTWRRRTPTQRGRHGNAKGTTT